MVRRAARSCAMHLLALLLAACHPSAPPPARPAAPAPLPTTVLSPRLAACGADVAEAPAWRAVPSEEARLAIAERFVADSQIPWDSVTVTGLGVVAAAVLDDESVAVPDDAGAGSRHGFWQTFLQGQDPVYRDVDLGTPAVDPDPQAPRDLTITVGAGSVYINWAGTFEEGSAHYRKRLWGEPSGLWPAASTELDHDVLTCIADIRLPTEAHVTYTHRDCPQCNLEPRERDLTVERLLWHRSPAIVTDGGGHVTRRWLASARPADNPVAETPMAEIGAEAWQDPRIGGLRLDANTAEDWSDLVCQPFDRIPEHLLCGPDAAAVEALDRMLQTPTTWIAQ